MAARHEEGCCEKDSFACFFLLVCKSLSNDDVGVARDNVFSGDMTGSWCNKNERDFVKDTIGGMS